MYWRINDDYEITIVDEGTETYVMAVKLDATATNEGEKFLKTLAEETMSLEKIVTMLFWFLLMAEFAALLTLRKIGIVQHSSLIFAHMYIKAHFKELSSGDPMYPEY